MDEAEAVQVVEAVLNAVAPMIDLTNGGRRHGSHSCCAYTLLQAHHVASEDEASNAITLQEAAVIRDNVRVRKGSELFENLSFVDDDVSERCCAIVISEERGFDEDVGGQRLRSDLEPVAVGGLYVLSGNSDWNKRGEVQVVLSHINVVIEGVIVAVEQLEDQDVVLGKCTIFPIDGPVENQF